MKSSSLMSAMALGATLALFIAHRITFRYQRWAQEQNNAASIPIPSRICDGLKHI
jgi:hypothetical protein